MIPLGIMAATTDHGGSIMATQQQALTNGNCYRVVWIRVWKNI
jgi:hypothetical protein